MYQVNYPVAFHTVDIAAVKGTFNKQVLMIRKKNEPDNIWRFPGGFIDVTDESAESAAIRELKEETSVELTRYDEYIYYLGSSKINDKRFKDGPHGILTSFFLINFNSRSPEAKAGDDAVDVKWLNLEDLDEKNVNDVHHPLLSMLKNHFSNYLYYKKWENTEKEMTKTVEDYLNEMKKGGHDFTGMVTDTTKKVINELKTIFEEITK